MNHSLMINGSVNFFFYTSGPAGTTKKFFFCYVENNSLKVVGIKLRDGIKGSSVLAAGES